MTHIYSTFLSTNRSKLLYVLILSITTSFSSLGYSKIINKNYQELRNLKNPYIEETQRSDLQQDSKEYISINGLNDRFRLCQGYGMATFINMANYVPKAKEYFTKDEMFTERSNMANLEFPFEKYDLEPIDVVLQLALTMGWEYQGKNPDSIARHYWTKCNELPISIFEDYWREE